jgi:hypothetical protein
MPAPHAFWVIVDGVTPTAFRAKQRDTLIPTLKQLQRTQPNVSLRWFDRGRLWDSPLAARDALRARRLARPDRRPEWRPGGNHVDPKERFKLTRDQKRARFKKRRAWGAEKQESWKAGKPESWKARKPESWKAGEPGSQEARKPGREARKPESWKAGKFGRQRDGKPGGGWKAGKFGDSSRRSRGRGRGPGRGGPGRGGHGEGG